jgi:hypothetical protein
MYKIKVFFKDGFRNTYECQNYVHDENELVIVNEEQEILINKRETTVISIIKVGEK